MRRLSHAYLALVLAFLYLPILVMVVIASSLVDLLSSRSVGDGVT